MFDLLAGAHTNDAIQAIEREISPLSARHWDSIYLNGALFRRIEALHDRRDLLDLTAEQRRVLERYHIRFKRAGAALDADAKARLAAINERLATLGTAFSQNVLADEQGYTLVLETEADLAGLPDFLRAARAPMPRNAASPASTSSRSGVRASSRSCSSRRAAICARRRSRPGSRAATAAARPTTRRSSPRWWRCATERARLLGYDTFAHFRLDDAMAKTPEAVRTLLERVWEPARSRALADRDAMQALIAGGGRQFRARALGLALLRREAAQGALRRRRGRDQAVLPARPHHRGGVRYRQPAVRPDLQAAHGHPGLARRRAGLGGDAAPAAVTSDCSSATTSRAPPSTAAPG